MEVKRYENKMIDLGATVPDWMYVSYFGLGLGAKYETVVYDLGQSVVATETEWDIDQLTDALAEHDYRKRQSNDQA